MTKHYRGRMEVICGSMFSGKTEELIRRVRRARIAKRKVQVFKPMLDNRFHAEQVASHNGLQWEAVPVGDAREILERLAAGELQLLFGTHAIYGPEGVNFYTRQKVVISRWPDPIHRGVDLGFPQHG